MNDINNVKIIHSNLYRWFSFGGHGAVVIQPNVIRVSRYETYLDFQTYLDNIKTKRPLYQLTRNREFFLHELFHVKDFNDRGWNTLDIIWHYLGQLHRPHHKRGIEKKAINGARLWMKFTPKGMYEEFNDLTSTSW